ncbi:MAG: porin [Acetobacteraceae bacterium]|nr:MAG: porin [Acetobacteraceae bacterium]
MKKFLVSTAVLALSAGVASAEVTTTGTARMGIIDDFGDVGAQFSSRFRVIFTASGETDGGLAFGATVRNDQSGVGNTNNNDSSVFVSGAFGKLSMGDVDGAANAAVGQVDGVGYTGLSDLNEVTYIGTGGSDFGGVGPTLDDPFDTSALYEYTTGSISLYVSATQWDQTVGAQAVSFAGKYATGNYSVSLGYENLNASDDYIWEQYVLGGSATFGAITVKAIYADGQNNQGDSWTQHAVSATYAADAISVSAFVSSDEDLLDNDLGTSSNAQAYGLGAAYDLGGGAKVSGGYVKNETDDTSALDLGLSFSF